MKGIEIKNKKKLYFSRHAESYGNIGKQMLDAPLTDNGIEQAKKLEGHFDCIVISTLRRTKETLHYSKITYDHLIINDNFRERNFNPSDRLILDKQEAENDQEFYDRVNNFHQELEELCLKYDNILLIGHAYYFNCWFLRSCCAPLKNAEIIELL